MNLRLSLPHQSARETGPTALEFGTETDLRHPSDAAATFERIYARYLEPIYRFLYAGVGNQEDAEDLTSETFLKAARQLDPGRSEATIARWLFTVARTVLADHWRAFYRYGALLPLDELYVAPVAVAETPAVDGTETEHRVAGILAALPPRYRHVLELRLLRGYSVAETAQELGVTPKSVKVIQHRALAKAVEISSNPPPPGAGPGAEGLSERG